MKNISLKTIVDADKSITSYHLEVETDKKRLYFLLCLFPKVPF